MSFKFIVRERHYDEELVMLACTDRIHLRFKIHRKIATILNLSENDRALVMFGSDDDAGYLRVIKDKEGFKVNPYPASKNFLSTQTRIMKTLYKTTKEKCFNTIVEYEVSTLGILQIECPNWLVYCKK